MRIVKHSPAGFTLLELVVTIAILGILVSLALPSYQDSVRKGRRADAQAKIRNVEVCAARVFTVDSSFADLDNACAPEADDYYTYTFPVLGATAYTVQAAPKPGQASDPCGTMTINQAGAPTAIKGGDDVTDKCWR